MQSTFCPSLCSAGKTLPHRSRVAATLEGMIKDSSGAAMSGSKARVRNTLTSQSRTVTTNVEGFFRAEHLAVGTYEIEVEQA